ncbi:hypothetical protein MRB53_038990 [Persea americana]|nr:hypothetical protein MRB53_038990 [Persea americana]
MTSLFEVIHFCSSLIYGLSVESGTPSCLSAPLTVGVVDSVDMFAAEQTSYSEYSSSTARCESANVSRIFEKGRRVSKCGARDTRVMIGTRLEQSWSVSRIYTGSMCLYIYVGNAARTPSSLRTRRACEEVPSLHVQASTVISTAVDIAHFLVGRGMMLRGKPPGG